MYRVSSAIRSGSKPTHNSKSPTFALVPLLLPRSEVTPIKMRRIKLVSFEEATHPQQISSLWFILVMMLFGGSFMAWHHKFNSLPIPNMSDNDTALEFNSRRAREHLTELTKFGPKVAGSVLNEVYAVEYLLSQVDLIKQTMHPTHELDIDVQISDGSIFLGTGSVYHGAQNVVVRLRNSDDANPTTCLLINSHYDSVAVSPGGGDANSMISVMLETLRVLAMHEDPFEHGIIFLFNGCEENNLLASHAFVTQHQWASTAKAVLNLDAAGNGGREIMFQASEGHSWLMNYYRKHAPHPFASAMGEELFQADMVPSDTDFRIFRDYGGIPGMDFAYSTNGYVYHTKHDTADIVPDGTLQHTGDNILALAKALANAEELKDTTAHMDEAAIFFDFMNAFMIYYTKDEAVIINVTIMLFCVALQIVQFVLDWKNERTKFTSISLLIAAQFVFFLLGCLAPIGLSFFYNAINRTMRWYNNSFLIFLIYMCPMFFFMSLGPALVRRWTTKMTPWKSVQHMLNFHSWLLIAALVVTIALNVRSGFMVMVPLSFYSVSLMFQIVLKCFRANDRLKLIVHYFVQIFPFAFYSTWTVVAFATFMPFAGRNGVSQDPEILISAFAIGMGLLLAGFLTPTIPMFKSPIGVSLSFAVMWLIGLILMLTPIGFPYAKETAPQRHSIHHVKSTFYNQSSTIRREYSSFFVQANDPNSEMLDHLSSYKKIDHLDECDAEWLCGLPMMNSARSASFMLEAPAPIVPYVESDLRMLGEEQLNGSSNWRFNFELTCPNRCVIYISPVVGSATLGSWSLYKDGKEMPSNWQLYAINYHNLYVEDRPNLNFWIEMEIRDEVVENRFRVGILAHYTADRNAYTEEYQNLLNTLPDWTTTYDWISTFKSYVF